MLTEEDKLSLFQLEVIAGSCFSLNLVPLWSAVCPLLKCSPVRCSKLLISFLNTPGLNFPLLLQAWGEVKGSRC